MSLSATLCTPYTTSGNQHFIKHFSMAVETHLPVSRTPALAGSAMGERVGLTQTVETVEKVPFQKLIFEKWDRNIEKRLVFCLANNILVIFELVVGDFL